MKKRFVALALTAGLVLGLCAGCSTPGQQMSRHNAVVYVQGVLDETYTGKAQETYYALVGHTEADARQAFEKNLEAEFTQRLCLRFDLDEQFISRELKEDYLALLDQVYQRAGYTVKTATELDNGRYCVELSVTPVTFFAAAYSDGYKALKGDFEKDHPEPEEESGKAPAQQRKEREGYEALWAKTVYDYLYARLDAVTTGAAVTKLALISADKDGLYHFSETDLQEVDGLILQY